MINTKKNMFFSDGSGGKHFKEILERVRLQDAVNDGRKVRKIASVRQFLGVLCAILQLSSATAWSQSQLVTQATAAA